MRMRRKPWAEQELAACPFFTDKPHLYKNAWHNRFARLQPLHLELGCGKGSFIAQLSALNPQINYIGVDIKDAVLGLAVHSAYASFSQAGRTPDNLWIAAQNIESIHEMLGEEDVVSRIYINFCNPWPKQSHQKRRLTHTRQLQKYLAFMPAGEIHFKTDDAPLFRDSLGYLEQCGFAVDYVTHDLHNSSYSGNILTEHEKMYSDEGKPIHFLIARTPAQ